MTTRDPNTLELPQEARIPAGNVPSPTHTLSAPAQVPSAGTSGAALRSPTQPTMPEFDPTSLAVLLQKMGNEFLSPSLPQNPQSVASATLPHTLPTSDGPSPFQVNPTFAAALAPEPLFTIPLFDAPEAPREQSAPNVPEARLPASHATFAEPVVPASQTHSPSVPASAVPPAQEVERAPASPNVPTSYSSLTLEQPVGALPREEKRSGFDANSIKREFPILDQRVNGHQLVWLDNAATTQKPRAVIDRLKKFYEFENSNVHRAAHTLAARSSDAYEGARETVRRFINAQSAKEIVFLRGTTEAINLVAKSWGATNVKEGDEILISHLEHHANIVPWQQLCAATGAKLKVAPVDDTGQIILEEYEKLLNERTKLVSFTLVSNALGTITPAQPMISMAHARGAKVLLDGAQGVSHLRVDMQLLDCDFFVFSGHKIFAPTGIGALYGKEALLNSMPPWQGGGNMIADVTFEKTVFHPAPARFEAGTGNIADAVGMGAALDWVTRVGLENIAAYEHTLLEYATERLHEVPGLKLYGTAPTKAGVLSFTLKGQKTEDMSAKLDKYGIAVRSGHHCAQPILRRFGLEATVRASLAPYNTHEDVDALVEALKRIQGV